jgi:hypothetical protein
VTVLDDEWDEVRMGGCGAAEEGACDDSTAGGEGDCTESSGLAIRSPPSVSDRLMSPFMAHRPDRPILESFSDRVLLLLGKGNGRG